jgi:hypothetical protein
MHSWKPAVGRGGKEAQRVPPFAPRLAEARRPVEDHEVDVARIEMVGDGESGLAGADDDGLEAFHAPTRWDERTN